MLQVKTDNLIPISQARFDLGKLINRIAKKKEYLVLTKLGRPKAALIDIDYLGELIRSQEIGDLLTKARESFQDYLRSLGYSDKQIQKMSEKKMASLLLEKKG